MRARWIFGCLLISTIFILTGCSNSKMKQAGNEDIGDSNMDIVNTNSVTSENSNIGKDKTEVSVQDNTNIYFTKDEIIEFLLYADTLADKIVNEDTSSEKVIGEYDGTDVVEINGEYDTFDKVKKLMGDYYTDEIIEMELVRRYLVNLYGKIGGICASGEDFYNISEKSQINLLVDEDIKKVIEIDAFNDNEDISKVEYTIEKQNSGKWIITDEKGYLNVNIDEIEKKFYYHDEVSLVVSSELDDYPSINALDDDLQTAWVEGAEGNGIGEWLEFKADGNKEISGLKIINGYTKTKDIYYENNRVKKINIEFPDNTVIEKDLEDGVRNYQTIDFGKVVDVNDIKITIIDVFPGSKYNDTSISEIKVYR